MSVSLVTLAQAKKQMRIRHDEEDDDIQSKMELATFQVLQYLEEEDTITGSPVEWDDTTVPLDVKAGILALTEELFRFRGNEEVPERGPNGVFSKQVEGYLKMRRPPALA